jgi:hypothetical protein
MANVNFAMFQKVDTVSAVCLLLNYNFYMIGIFLAIFILWSSRALHRVVWYVSAYPFYLMSGATSPPPTRLHDAYSPVFPLHPTSITLIHMSLCVSHLLFNLKMLILFGG